MDTNDKKACNNRSRTVDKLDETREPKGKTKASPASSNPKQEVDQADLGKKGKPEAGKPTPEAEGAEKELTPSERTRQFLAKRRESREKGALKEAKTTGSGKSQGKTKAQEASKQAKNKISNRSKVIKNGKAKVEKKTKPRKPVAKPKAASAKPKSAPAKSKSSSKEAAASAAKEAKAEAPEHKDPKATPADGEGASEHVVTPEGKKKAHAMYMKYWRSLRSSWVACLDIFLATFDSLAKSWFHINSHNSFSGRSTPKQVKDLASRFKWCPHPSSSFIYMDTGHLGQLRR